MNIGDIVICRGKLHGIILELDDEDFDDDMIVWAKIMWSNGVVTWEDMIASSEDDVFKILDSNTCKCGILNV